MFCPKCGQEQFCPCTGCIQKHPRQIYYKQIVFHGWECSKCGLRKDISWWEKIELDIFEDDRKDLEEFDFINQHES